MTTRPPVRLTIDIASLDARQRAVHDIIVGGPRGVVQGPLLVWLTSPDLAERAQHLGAFCRYGTSLDSRLSELAILVTAAYWQAGFEWHVHAPIAVAAGIDAAAAAAILHGTPPVFARADERAVYVFSAALLDKRAVPDAIYANAVAAIGEKPLVELVGVLGYYSLISMTIKAFGVRVPDDVAEPFGTKA